MNTENVITTIERRKGDKKIKQNLVKTKNDSTNKCTIVVIIIKIK